MDLSRKFASVSPLKTSLLFLLLLVSICPSLLANTNLRNWQMTDGTRLHAELVDYNEAENQVYLRIREQDDSYYKLEDFTELDQAWLVEWLEVSEKLTTKLETLPGRYTHYNYLGELSNYDFYVYEPSSVTKTSNRPLMILFSAGPKGLRYLLRHVDAAEASGMTIVAMDHFGNTHTSEATVIQNERFNELLPQLEATIAHNPNQLFTGGTSGGALRAIRLTNRIERPWAGIYWNGGWLGHTKDLDDSYRAMKVIIVNGNNDKAANQILDRDLPILRENNCEIGIISFEGGHQIPPKENITKAFQWLLDDAEIVEVEG